MNVVAETTNDFFLGFDIINKLKNESGKIKEYELNINEDNNDSNNDDMTPEELSRKCCLSFLEEIFYVIKSLKLLKKYFFLSFIYLSVVLLIHITNLYFYF